MHSFTTIVLAGFALAIAASSVEAARKPAQTGFLFKSITVDKQSYPYTVYVPRNYDASKPWPLIMFLHGSGECGTDGSKPLIVGLGVAIIAAPDKWPFIVIVPQKPEAESEWEQYDTVLIAMLKQTQKDYKVDASRLYLTGLSQGGHGSWVLGAKHADLWAAVAPVCGYIGSDSPVDVSRPGLFPKFHGSPAELGQQLNNVPVWAFHGEADPWVPTDESRNLVAAVKAAGGNAKITTYPGVGHDCWDNAYGKENLGDWFLSHRKGDK